MLSLLVCCWPNCVLKSKIIFLSQINRRRSRSRLTKEKVPLHVITFYSGFLQTLLDVLQSGLPSLSERQLQLLRMASTSYEICRS